MSFNLPGGPYSYCPPLLPIPHQEYAMLPPLSELSCSEKENVEEKVEEVQRKGLTLFIGNIPEGVSNRCMENILKKCGSLVQWKRIVGTNGKIQSFGFCDFDDENSTMKALQVLNGFYIGEKKLTVKADEKLKAKMIAWLAEKRKAAGRPEIKDEKEEFPADEHDRYDFERTREIIIDYIRKYDAKLIPIENRPSSRVSDQKQSSRSPSPTSSSSSSFRKRKSSSSSSSGSNTEASYEKEEFKRVYKLKQKKYSHRVKNWERREMKRSEFYEKYEKNPFGQSEREAKKLREFLASYDDSEEDCRWYRGSELKYRRRAYDRERKWEEEDRLAEQQEIEVLGSIFPIVKPELNQRENVELKSCPLPSKGPTTPPIITNDETELKDTWKREESPNIKDIDNMIESVQTVPQISGIVATKKSYKQFRNVFGSLEEEEEEGTVDLRIKKVLKPFEITSEDRLTHMTEEEKSVKIKDIIENIPRNKEELFTLPIDRNLVDDIIINKRIRPWISKRVKEFLGEEEAVFSEFICGKIAKENDPHKILQDIKMILDDDAEVFMIKLWRLILFESEAKKHKIPL